MLLFQIEQNEWIGTLDNWDIECIGPVVTIRRGLRRIVLQIRCMPPDGLAIEALDTFYNGIPIKACNGSA
jgi:hypothetical protein